MYERQPTALKPTELKREQGMAWSKQTQAGLEPEFLAYVAHVVVEVGVQKNSTEIRLHFTYEQCHFVLQCRGVMFFFLSF